MRITVVSTTVVGQQRIIKIIIHNIVAAPQVSAYMLYAYKYNIYPVPWTTHTCDPLLRQS